MTKCPSVQVSKCPSDQVTNTTNNYNYNTVIFTADNNNGKMDVEEGGQREEGENR